MGSFGGFAHEVLELCKGRFDRVVMMTLQSGFLLKRGIG